ncbi:hypothetical protein [Elizabethkingia miricola]|uniref:hypothetical protein n=2 Tax=Elizabethkingia miricola TaxID=172045 RepID=UPI000C14CF81|nr:hypothetical protein [Elizabethkingia miricola]PSL86702.1 hypothetical protein C7V10_19305 [Elizabethkingia miricola]QHQ85801.1 hypothetical protein FE632_02895 [Elizabethkingia miricola]UIO97038.1 hypothetical protein LYZ41_02895 [Elizabethkingia miricola]WER13822.1 hypothetical protein P0M31_02910 [Elizabethkingia miricola]WGL73998.1 hypothetical protein QFB80_02900 [Elizabethkingia miricola]
MKRILFASFSIIITSLAAQSNCETLKTQIASLQSENKELASQNEYFKKILKINTPFLETTKDGTNFKIIKVVGDKTTKSIYITLLLETKDENKSYLTISEPASIIDMEGNDVKINWDKSVEVNGNLTLNAPKKIIMAFTYKDNNLYSEEPRIIKLFKFKFISKVDSKKYSVEDTRTILEFNDLNINWK